MRPQGIELRKLHCSAWKARYLPDLVLAARSSKGPLIEPRCMDRLPFASEAVLSEVADMYPARLVNLSGRGMLVVLVPR